MVLAEPVGFVTVVSLPSAPKNSQVTSSPVMKMWETLKGLAGPSQHSCRKGPYVRLRNCEMSVFQREVDVQMTKTPVLVVNVSV